MKPTYFEEFKVGERFVTHGRTITDWDVYSFAGLTADWNPLHVDEEWCKEKSQFKRRIAHGPLTTVLGLGLITRLGCFDGSVIAFLGIDKLRIPAPVFIGDTIHSEMEVIETKRSSKGQGIVRFKAEVKNQRHEVVVHFEIANMMKNLADA
ncbi:MAG: MaoC family dehydratase N-terminal domain-containing protein [Candidatus Tectomicrobia bacterium]|uniref:MaoC family dehydratase N-terminal domain-containing protein n=1 Tax=Tectimicrobiota bacterium TaxID=2528274 RepID=A0A933GKW3_UNCTE|nr:MaoC family dehydratase N-terminal domain-containing protein [Candidatus Tectomicrobia bacterium]